jgi:hypothetical protein
MNVVNPVATVVIAAAVGALGGCGTDHSESSEARAARDVARRFFAAQARADGRTFCGLLSDRRRAFEDRAAHVLGARVTCAQAESAHPPGIDHQDLVYLSKARRVVSRGTRIESVTVHDAHAIVRWSGPALDKSTLDPTSGTRPTGKLYLLKQRGRWRIDLPPRK